ncbi:hypothetical protein SRABI27_03110 [Pedobacter sp. Bi27]|uniref:hypothetical protein n=1 Tax=unclassified Pedobacter TaxID=2628915 RepID=UPI001DC09700|nr:MULTISPECIES: hypothetical protein [unclassified Pedobacter]CAH0142220.1 hypothetical protein SRABI36_00573 [Pedobacter sp. Bi36]CAH0197970.1 hypothetical protein SRABI126_01667 [Pedobacter sp. Bi126]CAH0256778.1 hypothetical protein SRABI27_03110 [Pedobacter sp. Bi27]
MSEHSTLRLTMSATLDPNEWEKLEQLMAEAKIFVPTEGPGVLIHEGHYDPETHNVLFLESYADEHALLKHAEVFGQIMNKYKVDWKIKRIDLLGNYSPEIFAMLKGMANGAEVNLYNHVFKNK